jgi:siroheme synthase (precorrin-2 oxidase/ferrochelatase)
MTDYLAIARECGAIVADASITTASPRTRITLLEPELSAFAERVRQDERERAEQEAKRYRWWSSRPNIRLNLFQGKYRIVDSEYLITDWHESADAAIDAAMAQQVPERAE